MANEFRGLLTGVLSGAASSMQRKQKQEDDLGMALAKIMLESKMKRESGEYEWKPKTQAEALQFEREKYGIKSDNPLERAKRERANLTDSTKLREEFLNRPEVKDYVLVGTQVKSMGSLLQKAKEGNLQNKAALDQALITMFNKLTDPQSVVRESEYARTPENLPLINRFSGALEKVGRGGAGLTDADRDALVWGAKVIYNERGTTFNSTLSEYVKLGEQYGIEPSLITRGMRTHKNLPAVTPTMPNTVKSILGGGKADSDILKRLNLDPNKYEVVR